MKVSMSRFRQLVAEALDELPPEFRRQLNNVEVVVEDVPPREVLRQFPGGLLLGLCQGVPLPQRSVMGMSMPDLISIYKRNIEKICSTEEEIRQQVADTVKHEIGHHFGLDEDELEDI